MDDTRDTDILGFASERERAVKLHTLKTMPETERQKIIRIFRYLKELDEMRNPVVRRG